VGLLGLSRIDPAPPGIVLVDFIVGALLFWLGRWMIREPLAQTPRLIVVALITIGSLMGLWLSDVPAARSAGMILPVLFAVVATGRIFPIALYPVLVLVGLFIIPAEEQKPIPRCSTIPLNERTLSVACQPDSQFTGFEFGFALLLFLLMWSVREHAAWQGAQRAEAAAKLQQEQIMTTFMRFIAHELRGTAAVLSALAPTLHARLTVPPDHWTCIDGEAAYTAYADTTKRLDDLLQRLLIITRTGVLSSEQTKRVALVPLLMEAVNEIRALDVPIEVDCEIPPDLEVLADPAYLSMACTTAIRNAAEAMNTSDRQMIKIRAFRTAEHTTIRFEDTGPGFPPHLLTQLQSMGTTNALPVGMFTTKVGGTGIGLPLMDRVARLHDGTFSYGNLPEQGAWVEIVLPHIRNDQTE
jgi:signal transduction histidine kinase